MNNSPGSIQRLLVYLGKIEAGLLLGLLLSMILLAVIQIFLRNFHGTGIIWAESLVRILVLWTAVIGAMLGSRKGQHIAIDVISNMVTEKNKRIIQFSVNLFTAVVCSIVAYYSMEFVWMEYQDGGIAFASVPNWLCESIIPIAFFIITIRYILLAFAALKEEVPAL